MIVHGLMVSDTPFWCGKALSQKTTLQTSSMTIHAGSLLNGSTVHALRHLSLTVHIYRLISPTCSSSATSFNRIPRFAMSPCRFSNCPSISIQSTLNPPCAYGFLMFLIACNRSSAFVPVSGSTIPNHILRDIDTINGMELTNMMSVHTVAFWYRLSIPHGIASRCVSTRCGGRHTVFPFSPPTSGPKMSSAAQMSSPVIGQLGSRFLEAIFINSQAVGFPILICSSLAARACR